MNDTHDPVTATVQIVQRYLQILRVLEKTSPEAFRDDLELHRLVGLLMAARDKAEASRLLEPGQREQALRFIASALPAARLRQLAGEDEAA